MWENLARRSFMYLATIYFYAFCSSSNNERLRKILQNEKERYENMTFRRHVTIIKYKFLNVSSVTLYKENKEWSYIRTKNAEIEGFYLVCEIVTTLSVSITH